MDERKAVRCDRGADRPRVGRGVGAIHVEGASLKRQAREIRVAGQGDDLGGAVSVQIRERGLDETKSFRAGRDDLPDQREIRIGDDDLSVVHEQDFVARGAATPTRQPPGTRHSPHPLAITSPGRASTAWGDGRAQAR
jgi:hypothetical protein